MEDSLKQKCRFTCVSWLLYDFSSGAFADNSTRTRIRPLFDFEAIKALNPCKALSKLPCRIQVQAVTPTKACNKANVAPQRASAHWGWKCLERRAKG